MVLSTKVWVILGAVAIQSLLARVLAPEGRGAFAVCAMFGTMLGVLLTPGADRGSQYFVMSGRFSLSLGTSVGLLIGALGSLLAIAFALPLIQSDLSFFEKASTSAFYITLLLVPLTVATSLGRLQLAGLRRFGPLAIFSVVQIGMYLLAVLTLVWYLDLGVEGAILSLSLSHLVYAVFLFRDLRRRCGMGFVRPRFSDSLQVLSYGCKYHVARVGTVVDLQVGGLFLAFMATPAEIGLYTAAMALIIRIFIVADSIESSLLPRVAEDLLGRPDLVGQCARLSGLVTAALLVVLVAVSVPLVRILLSDAFLPSATLIWILAPGILVYSAARIFLAYFRGVNRPGVCSWAVWVGLSVNLGSLALLYPMIGLPAAAWSMTIGFFCRSVILVIAFRRISTVRFAETWTPRREDFVLMVRSTKRIFGRFSQMVDWSADA